MSKLRTSAHPVSQAGPQGPGRSHQQAVLPSPGLLHAVSDTTEWFMVSQAVFKPQKLGLKM